MSGKRILIFLMVILLIWGLCGCKKEGERSEDLPPAIQVDPDEGASNTGSQKVMLYFANEDYTMLVGEAMEIEVPVSSRVEYSVLKALIYGPKTNGVEFNPIINPQTRVVDIEETQDYISITLSEEFLDWDFIPETNLSAEAKRRIKQLSVYAIVNSIVESSVCKKVQLLVKQDTGRTGRRITLAEVGMNGSGILEPLSRSGEVVLSPEKTLEYIFAAISAKDYPETYYYLAYADEKGSLRPPENTFSVWLQTKNVVIENCQIMESVETADLQSTILMVDYTLNISGEGRKELRNIPIKMIKENGIWKITYGMIEQLF